MLELYHFDRSTAAQIIRLALAEKGLEWEGHYINTGFEKRDQRDPDYLKINLRGVVPTLVHDGKVVREFNIILEYIEDVFADRNMVMLVLRNLIGNDLKFTASGGNIRISCQLRGGDI